MLYRFIFYILNLCINKVEYFELFLKDVFRKFFFSYVMTKKKKKKKKKNNTMSKDLQILIDRIIERTKLEINAFDF